MKYTHRVSIPASIVFDVESDNAEVTEAEVRALIDGEMDFEEGFSIATSDCDTDMRAYPDYCGQVGPLAFDVMDIEENEEAK